MFYFRIIYDFLKRQQPILFSLSVHFILYLFFVTLFYKGNDIQPQKFLTSIQIDKLPEFTGNKKAVEKTITTEKRGGLIPAKKTTADERPKGEPGGIGNLPGDVPVTGIPGNSEFGNSNGTGSNPGTDVYRVGVETAPEAFGGIVTIQSKIPKNHPDYESSRGRTIYILVFVDESGIVRKAHISKGLGNSLDFVIASIVRKTRFSPGKDKGRIVKTQLMMNITIP